MGNNLFFRAEWLRAEEYYKRALQLDPDSTDLMEDYVSLLTYSWQLDSAQQMAQRMIELDPYVPVFLLAKSLVEHAKGEFEQRDRTIDAALRVNPDLGNVQIWKLLRMLQYGQFEEARQYALQMNPLTFDHDDVLLIVDWVSHPEEDPDPVVLGSSSSGPLPALLAGRLDLWLYSVELYGAIWKEWELTATPDLLAPFASPELMHQYRADPRVKAWLTKLRLPEYWREVGWPDFCEPIGEDDFQCH
jgi:tetratricopeptide (TPR) repeat protein